MSVITYKRGDKTALTKNFSRYEFDCPCGCGTQMVDPELAEKLQRIRDVVGKKINHFRLPLSEAQSGRWRRYE